MQLYKGYVQRPSVTKPSTSLEVTSSQVLIFKERECVESQIAPREGNNTTKRARLIALRARALGNLRLHADARSKNGGMLSSSSIRRRTTIFGDEKTNTHRSICTSKHFSLAYGVNKWKGQRQQHGHWRFLFSGGSWGLRKQHHDSISTLFRPFQYDPAALSLLRVASLYNPKLQGER